MDNSDCQRGFSGIIFLKSNTMKKILFSLLLILILNSCSYLPAKQTQNNTIIPPTDIELAKLALTNFLSLLNQGHYEQALFYYGGDWENLIKLNPEITTGSKVKLLERYCQINGGICLKPSIIRQEQITANDYKFVVLFYKADEMLYLTAGCPCKGGGKSEFEFSVKKIGVGQYLILDLPPINKE
jgi:PBP1b-binding outer membrane lipoprotein LpoB